ncbi:unnamed protein product [Rotaria sordida]|uniref:Uncharacterized protein n=1 Tax=Rotaria sordida TaxID=392033 RepID=A0A814WCK5_9BILA|nr:unnamed protein product [Rotaria sordida]CAF3832739.1 unnamed protein product [Rotaria sordida]
MAGQGILIIIIPNDLNNNQEKLLDTAQIVKDPLELPIKSNNPTSVIEHSKEFPCSTCNISLTSRFRYHISPKLNLADAIWILSEDRQHFFITCFAELGQHSDLIIHELRSAEIGIRQGSKVFILPLSCALGIDNLSSSSPTIVEINNLNDVVKEITNSNESQHNKELNEQRGINKSDFKRSIRARLTVLQVVNAIRGQTLFSFDFLLLTILASIIASMGLLEDNSVILVASMLVSPLMGPILGIVFGLCISDSTLWKVGLRTEVIGLLITIFTGFIVGLCTTWSEVKWGSSTSFPTHEMRSRGDIRRLWAGALVALPSGAGAALSVLGGNVGSLVGVAISASLLPPAVNAGLLSSYSLLSALIPSIGKQSSKDEYYERLNSSINIGRNCTKFIGNDYIPIYSCHMATEAGLLGIFSFILTITNIICIIVVAMGILRIKEVVPIVRDDEIAQFWHNGVRTVRGHNKTMHRNDINNLVNMWKSIKSTDLEPLNIEDNNEESKINIEIDKQQLSLKHRNISQIILARKLQNLEEFANAYHLNLSNTDDRLLRTDTARENVQQMANDILASIEETNRINLGSFVAQMGGSNDRLLTRFRMQTFYQELVDVMPLKWKEIFEQCQQQST